MSPARAMYRKPAAAKARAYGSAPMARAERTEGDDRPEHRGEPGGQIQNQRPLAREPRVHQQRKVPDAVRNLVGGDGKGRDEAERDVMEKGGRNEHPIEGVVDAVTDQYQNTRGTLAVRVIVGGAGAARNGFGGPRGSAYATTAPASR